jgi:hypothetical protein
VDLGRVQTTGHDGYAQLAHGTTSIAQEHESGVVAVESRLIEGGIPQFEFDYLGWHLANLATPSSDVIS